MEALIDLLQQNALMPREDIARMLDLTVERVLSLPVLLIITFRPEFQPPWIGQPQVTTLALSRLDRRDRTALVEQIAGGKALRDDVIAQIDNETACVVVQSPDVFGLIRDLRDVCPREC